MPLFFVVAIDYVAIVGVFIQILASAYLVLHLLSFIVGFVAKGLERDLLKYRIGTFFPLLEAGDKAFSYLMEEVH